MPCTSQSSEQHKQAGLTPMTLRVDLLRLSASEQDSHWGRPGPDDHAFVLSLRPSEVQAGNADAQTLQGKGGDGLELLHQLKMMAAVR